MSSVTRALTRKNLLRLMLTSKTGFPLLLCTYLLKARAMVPVYDAIQFWTPPPPLSRFCTVVIFPKANHGVAIDNKHLLDDLLMSDLSFFKKIRNNEDYVATMKAIKCYPKMLSRLMLCYQPLIVCRFQRA